MVCLVLLLTARATDFLSTWIATPHLILEGNPIARKLGWKWGAVVNLALCFGFAFMPLPAIIIATTSVLVASHNFNGAWLMNSMGELGYRDWMAERMEGTSPILYLFCLFGKTGLWAVVGLVLIFGSGMLLVPLGIGLGILGYGVAVLIYSLISVWRLRRQRLKASR